MKPLTFQELKLLSEVKVSGIKFYPGAARYLKAIEHLPIEDQCLYLVAEGNNGLMLHNGHQKLGTIQNYNIRRLIDSYKTGGIETDEVVVLKIKQLHYRVKTMDEHYQTRGGSIYSDELASVECSGKYRVNERLARKFSDQFRKEL